MAVGTEGALLIEQRKNFGRVFSRAFYTSFPSLFRPFSRTFDLSAFSKSALLRLFITHIVTFQIEEQSTQGKRCCEHAIDA